MIRWWRRAWDNVCDFVGILSCLTLIVLIMPLVPVLKLYDDIRRRYEDE